MYFSLDWAKDLYLYFGVRSEGNGNVPTPWNVKLVAAMCGLAV